MSDERAMYCHKDVDEELSSVECGGRFDDRTIDERVIELNRSVPAAIEKSDLFSRRGEPTHHPTFPRHCISKTVD